VGGGQSNKSDIKFVASNEIEVSDRNRVCRKKLGRWPCGVKYFTR